MPTFKITLAYDGTEFAGWQLQPGQRTVQGVLEVVLRQLTGQTVRVLGASRTDTGVHALGQVAAFSLDTRLTLAELGRAMNALLPPDLVVLSIETAPDRFRPARDATRKRYRYLLYDGQVRHIFLRRYAWQMDPRLDAEAMDRAAQALVGTHDFASFQSRGSPRKDTVRTLFEVSVRRCRAGQGGQSDSPLPAGQKPTPDPQTGADQGFFVPAQNPNMLCDFTCQQGRAGQGDLVLVEVEGDGFLYHMVRTIVGTLLEVGRGKRPLSWVQQVLTARNRTAAGKTAPPEGLYLLYVRFDTPTVSPATSSDSY